MCTEQRYGIFRHVLAKRIEKNRFSLKIFVSGFTENTTLDLKSALSLHLDI